LEELQASCRDQRLVGLCDEACIWVLVGTLLSKVEQLSDTSPVVSALLCTYHKLCLCKGPDDYGPGACYAAKLPAELLAALA